MKPVKVNREAMWEISRTRTIEMLLNKNPPPYDGRKDWLGCTKGAAQMNHMLLAGTTIQDVVEKTPRKKRSSFHSHKNTLQRKHGLRISRIGKEYRFDLDAILTALGRSVPERTSGSSAGRGNSTVAREAIKLGDKYFSPDPPIDGRQRVLREIARRQGQPQFRENLLSAYGGACAVTGCTAVNALEAAHIDRYLGRDSHHLQNGLLLRSDIHTLFDQHLFRINPTTFRIEVSDEIEDQEYRRLHDRRLSLPDDEHHYPSKEALRKRYNEAEP